MPTATPRSTADPSGEEDIVLVRRIQAGHEDALQQLYRRYAPLVFHLACRALDRAAAEEVVQDAFLALWRRAAEFDPARGSFRTWLLSIGRHRMLDELRSRSRRPQTSGDLLLDQAALSASEPLQDETLWLEYQRDAVSEALAALPEPQRAALRLAFFADLTHEEVAKVLKVPLGTAKTRIRSGLRQLERQLGGLVALLLVALAGAASWLYHRHGVRDLQSDRALHLLADSQTRALRLVPGGAGPAREAGMHATFRGAPGSSLAVLTRSRFPALSPGEHDVLWIQTPQGWLHQELWGLDGEGKALQILETPWQVKGWPLALRISRETGNGEQPAGLLVEWQGPPDPNQPDP